MSEVPLFFNMSGEQPFNLNVLCDQFVNSLKNVVDSMVKEKLVPYNNAEWFNNDLRMAKLTKTNLYRQAVLSNDDNDWRLYHQCRNQYKTNIRLTKSRFIENQIETASTQKDMWQKLKKYVLKKSKETILEVEIEDGSVINDSAIISYKFNNFFVESIHEITQSVIYCDYTNLLEPCNIDFKFNLVNIDNIRCAIDMLNKKSDFNFMTVKMIKDSLCFVGPVIERIINISLSAGVFPQSWKESLIVPIKKIPNAKTLSDFRPINMMPLYEKIIEKCVVMQLQEHLESQGLLDSYQSGFRVNHSCETCLNFVISDWRKEIDAKNVVVAVFLDLKRAFETVNHEILLKKLKYYGIKSVEFKWFKSFLTGRTQRTSVNGKISSPIAVNVGIPQGTILGVWLFLMFINDMSKVIQSSKLILFADDGLLYTTGKNAAECFQEINQDLERINTWLKMNRLVLNVTKTKCMVFKCNSVSSSLNVNINVSINNEQIEQVKQLKYLGVMLDEQLNFNEHINYICKKISKKVGVLRKIRNNISMSTAVNLCNVLIKPHFDYCSSLLYMCPQSHKDRLQLQQNKVMRIILKCSRYTPIRNMLSTLQWLNINQRLFMLCMIFVFKIKNNMYPGYLCENVRTNALLEYNLRNNDDLRIERARTTRGQRTIFYLGFNGFNNLPREIKNINNINEFKRKIIEYVQSNNNL